MMHMSERVGYLPVALMPHCSCQISEVLLMVILLSPLLSDDGFLTVGLMLLLLLYGHLSSFSAICCWCL